MADIAQRAEQQQEGEKTFLGVLFAMPFQFIGVMFGSLLGAIIIEWVCMYVFWPDEGWKHAQRMFEYELGWLSQDLMRSVVVTDPGRTATWLTQTTYEWLIVKTGLGDTVSELTQYARSTPPKQADTLDARKELGKVIIRVQDFWLAALYTVLTFCLRMVVLTLTTPLFILAAFMGLVDGLVQRDLRKFGSGRESSYTHHKAKETIVPLMVMPWTIYLTLPISVNPLWIIFPCILLFSISVHITASSFKKHL